MTGDVHAGGKSDERALSEAAAWRVELADEPVPESRQRAFQRWLHEDPENVRAWQDIEQTWNALAGARRPAARTALESAWREERREVQRMLRQGAGALMLLLLLPVGWWGLGLPSPGHLFADHYTAVGERRTLDLPDGSRLTLDTDSAVELEYDQTWRRIRLLKGRLFVDVATEPGRPLEVVTDDGRALALGTRFSVQRFHSGTADTTRVTVHESRVRICPSQGDQGCRRLQQGQQADATDGRVGPVVVARTSAEPAWLRGQMAFENRPVTEVLDELARYHHGLLSYDHRELSELRVSGVVPVDNIDRALDSLASARPLLIRRYTPWLIIIGREP